MATLNFEHEPLATSLRFRGNSMIVELRDGRALTLPLSFYPTLLAMKPRERAAWRKIGPGVGFQWEEHDLDLSVRQFLEGAKEYVAPAKFRAKHPRPIDQPRSRRSAVA